MRYYRNVCWYSGPLKVQQETLLKLQKDAVRLDKYGKVRLYANSLTAVAFKGVNQPVYVLGNP